MESEHETTGEGRAAPARPPSVPESLWNAVPVSMRQEFIEAAARGLRRGIHPAESFSKMLKEKGLDAPARAAPRARTAPFVALKPAGAAARAAGPSGEAGKAPGGTAIPPAPSRPRPPGIGRLVPPRTPAPVRDPASASGGGERGSGPLVPWGTKSPPPGDAPRGVIGVAIHKAMNVPGAPGRAAAAAEASVLDAIAADPALAFWDPPSVLVNGARIPRAIAEEIAGHIAREAERVMEDARARSASGDPVARRWIDPEGWSFQHEEEPAPAPAP